MGLLSESKINIGISGDVRAIVTNVLTGETRNYEFHNICTNAFLNRIAQWIAGINNTGQNPALGIAKFQLGTGSGTPAAADSSLFTPNTSSIISIAAHTASTNQVTISINYGPNVLTATTYTEGGLLDENNVLLTHLMLSPTVAVTANEAVTFLYTITINTQ